MKHQKWAQRFTRLALPCAAAAVAAGLIAGCAASHKSVSIVSVPTSRAAAPDSSTRPQTLADAQADLPLSKIEPVPVLPSPATQPTGGAPLEALQLYAQARAALVDNQHFTAINLLRRAIKIDPYSFDLYNDLGKTLQITSNSNSAAMAAFEKASALRPDDLSVHYQLGRGYLAEAQIDKALLQLRLAQMTSEYRQDDDRATAALVDFFLGRALEQHGYDRAALEQFTSLLSRLRWLGNGRGNGELAFLIRHPAILYAQIGDLYIKRAQPTEALSAYQSAAASDPDNFDLQNRLTRTLELAGHSAQAREHAVSLVLARHADVHSIELLKDVCHAEGHDERLAASLQSLHDAHPQDRDLLFALVDALSGSGKNAQAQRLLTQAAQKAHGDSQIITRLFNLCLANDDVEGAMRLLVTALADRPDSLRELGGLFNELLKPAHGTRLRLALLQKLKVPAADEASRQFWVARVAEIWGRDALAHSALDRSADLTPPFAPTYRELVGVYFDRPDWDAAQKAQASAALADRAAAQGAPALAAELRGLSFYAQKRPSDAAAEFTKAAAIGNPSTDLLLMQAQALNDIGEHSHATRILWNLVHEAPHLSEAYSELFALYIHNGAGDQAAGALKAWLEADPTSVDGRILQATLLGQSGDADSRAAAKSILNSLFIEQPHGARILAAMETFYTRTDHLGELANLLEDQRLQHPDNREVVEALVSIYSTQHRTADAIRVLDAARAAVGRDPDLLYYIAHLYERIDQKQTTEQILEEVVQIDPTDAAASNDLGYTWADQGRNLDRAEALIRVAVDAEPDNQSYLDSLGWVSYKRGKFSQAQTYLNRAVGPSQRPDPVVLDHLGDALYRLDQRANAASVWKRSLERLDGVESEREDLKNLRQTLLQKVRQEEDGKPVNVAPVVEMPAKEPMKSTQAHGPNSAS